MVHVIRLLSVAAFQGGRTIAAIRSVLTPGLVYLVAALCWVLPLSAEEPVQLETVEVVERADNFIGIATNATEGTVGAKQLQERPLLRPGEVLETVPGVIITQHSGSGKANQFFLRGFNLDHGTDFATYVDGMPVNLPTHAHGQGYTDLNFLIPELIQGVGYRKGPYYAEEGDFSAAGAAHIDYADTLPQGIAEATVGSFDYYRALLAGSTWLAQGHLLGAFEFLYNNGPWDHPDDFHKYNGVLRYSQGDRQNGFSITGMAYKGDWNATDQIPQRAVDSGLISRFGAIDPSDGGESHRFSLSGDWRRGDEGSATHISANFINYHLDLFSNFTFFLDDPVNGDQFEQADDRRVYGIRADQHWFNNVAGFEMENIAGLQLCYDDIDKVGLFKTVKRRRLSTTRADKVEQLSVSPYLENRTQWLPKFRTVSGLRGDIYHFDVESSNPLNAGSTSAGLASPKFSLIFGPWLDTEYYVSLGYGFHSNDGRGATIRVDPKTGNPVQKVDPLVQAKGAEVGARSAFIPNLQTTLSFFLLDLDSELLFLGDAGTTETSRPSRRIGVEWTNYYTPLPWLALNADFAFTRARFRDDDLVDDHIPGAIGSTIAAGITIDDIHGFFGGVRLRYFGPRPLIGDNSVRSSATTLVNADIGYKFDKKWRVTLGIFNLLDFKDHDIDYFYTSRLPGEPLEDMDDIHFHPVEPRAFRLTLTGYF